jgi:two-component system, chemotaxis family, CheB/CheR fusion protein
MKKKKKRQNSNRAKPALQRQKVAAKASTKNNSTGPKASPPENRVTKPVSVVGVGASAGGLEAFQQLLAALPDDSGMAFALVQHLAPKHESILSELLARNTKMPVTEVTEGTTVEPNHVYVIPPNADMAINHGVLHLFGFNDDRARRMPIDYFFRSLAEDQEGRAIGVILSGSASDGTLGLQAIKAHGGVTFAQDEETAKYYAMPRNAAAAGNVDFVLPPDLIARELTRIAEHIHIFASEDQATVEEPEHGVEPADEALSKIFLLLRNVSRVDFSYYKHGTIKRRITRRMFLRKIDTLPSYLQYLRKNPDEVEALFDDILINVTGFFRDPDAFEALKKNAFPGLLDNKATNSPLRIWVPGCSTGEEAYSLAIVLLEYLGDRAASLQTQIFATDVSDSIIGRSRLGIFPESIAMDMSSERLRRHFQKVEAGYQISKTIRDMCVFAKQDITRDPPFSKIDMISCRNVMIYMGSVLQKRIIPLFHYALSPNGVLFLGSSETVGSFSNLFVAMDKKYRIYTKKPFSIPFNFDFVPQFEAEIEPKMMKHQAVSQRPDLQKIADQILLNRYTPASVVVDDSLDIVHFIGQTGRFLDPAPGDASLNLLKMVKPGLHVELRLAFQRARREGTARQEGVLVEHNGGLKTINFEIIPMRNVGSEIRHFMVIFEDVVRTAAAPSENKTNEKQKPEKKAVKTNLSKIEVENTHLREELEATREYLQSIIEEQRTTNEELRSANEEVQSSNEELQSINEELETAKEELQSTNEELTTVNEELQNRNDELTNLNNDLNNLLSSVSIPILMLGKDLRIRRFTPMAERAMHLIGSDVGRPITDIKANFRLSNLQQTISHVIDSLQTHESEVEDNEGKWYSMKIRPYRTADNKIDGVVIVFLDLDKKGRTKSNES